MKKYYFFKCIAIFTFFSFLTTSVWAIDETVSPGGNIQTAINNVAASGGGIVTLAAGTHNIVTSIRMKSNVTLQGEGNWASLLKTTVNMKMIIADAEGLVNMIIQNLAIEGTNASNGGGIEIASLGPDNDNVQVLNVHCYKTGWGVHIKGATNVLVKDCLFEENGTAGKEGFAHNMYLRRVYGAIVRNSKFLNSTSANGINISYSTDVEIYNCEMSGNYFRGVRAANTDGYLVHDCIVKNNGNVGILANSEGVPTTNIDIKRNCVSNNTLEGLKGVNGVTGVASDNNSYGNGTNYDFPSSVTQSGNISDSNIDCIYNSDPRIVLTADTENNAIVLNWVLENITLGSQKVFRDTDSDPSGRSLIASNVTGLSYTDNTAADDTPYWYWIEATDVSTVVYNSNGDRAILATQPLVELFAAPGDGYVSLNWDVYNITLADQDIFRDTDSNPSGRIQIAPNVDFSTSNYTDNNVVNGVTYWYWVKVKDGPSDANYNSNAADATPGLVLSTDDLQKKNSLNVFPNPVSSHLTMLVPTAEFTDYTICDIHGRINMKGAIPKGVSKFGIDMSSLSKGIYLISVKGNQSSKVLKIVKN